MEGKADALVAVLYLTKNGLLEPLGQSQILPYLRGLSNKYKFTLVTYEKLEDRSNTLLFNKLKAECALHSIRWIPQNFQTKPRNFTVLLNLLHMFFIGLREARDMDVKVIHSRSYLPTLVAFAITRFTKTVFIFDMRALWPEELIMANRLKRNSIAHKILKLVERNCLKYASGIVSLTHSAVAHLNMTYPKELKNKKIKVIPTCVDLNRFTLKLDLNQKSLNHGCVGTILSGWFLTEWLSKWFCKVAELEPTAKFQIITRDCASSVRYAIDPENKLRSSLIIEAKPPSEMPKAFQNQSVSVMFFSRGLGKVGSAPTRLAEALASGLPIVTNGGVGDVKDIIYENRVGVILNSLSDEDISKAFEELTLLQQDPELSLRCRRTAETIFSLEAGIESYQQLYSEIVES